ncbi:MAG: GNAT family N-acetyltransferase [Dehalococcoidales bacterium]|nr:GNAT family N-acetyltransferase [Dehalococcoidales bacterium]
MKLGKSVIEAGFKPLGTAVITGSKIRLREKRLSDAHNDYRWQSDPELARLDATSVLDLPFSLYFIDYASALRQTQHNRFPLAVDTLEGRHIGNCTCYDIEEDQAQAQFGIMIGNRDYWNKGYGADAVNTMVDYVFRTTRLNRLYLKTLDWNIRAQKCFTKCGFVPFGRLNTDGYRFILMEIKRKDWEKRTPQPGIPTGKNSTE